ncbi:Decapping and exoribonuclease protein [Frankliniella fusca]|uniref:Decapping and exoribonuclease protein n=1 Tax=Frankliniella fusca TaxID=407009 RepID=A0AAE1HQC7_9NEOP|nr:Decapping and exoribonuclease protein [Frankliniella fusca]
MARPSPVNMNSISKNRPSMRVWVKPSATFPPFAQPMVVSYFSLDQDRRFTPDTSQLRYMYLPREAEGLGWDLNHGLAKVQRSDHAKSIERIDNLLRGILASGLSVSQEVASFMCLRGLLTRIMTTPYEQNQGWEILVSRFRGVLFMCAQETPEQRRERMGATENQKRFSSWGFKFEQYITTDQPGCPPETEAPVKEGEEFCCLFRTKLSDRRLLYGAEMDAVTCDVPLEDCLEDLMLSEFVELKTSRKLTCVRQERNFKRFKLLNWWAQNFLVNVAHIICGFRDDRGIVEKLEFYKVEEIPKMAKDLWVPAVCMTFLDQFLNFVGRTVWDCPHSNDPNTVWRFRWEPGVHYVTGDVIPGSSQLSFLPDWFLSSVVAKENHPLQSCIRVFSSKHGKQNHDDQRSHTAAIFAMTKDISVQRASGKRPPSPRSIMLLQKGIKPSDNKGENSSEQSTVSSPSSSNTNQTMTSPKNQSNSSTENEQASLSQPPRPNQPQNANGPHKPRRHRRRVRHHTNQIYRNSPHQRHGGNSDYPSFQSSSRHRNHTPLQPRPEKKTEADSVTVAAPKPTASGTTSLQAAQTSAAQLDVLSESNSFSADDLPPTGLSHPEDIVYPSSYDSLENSPFLIPQAPEEQSPSSSADHYSSQPFLESSPSNESYAQQSLISTPLSSPSLLPDCYSSQDYSVCDELPQATYLVSSDVEYLDQEAYMQADDPNIERSYLSSPSAVEYINQPSFLPVTSSDELGVTEVFLETTGELPPSSLLSPVTSIAQAFLGSNSDISTEDIRTAEGSLTTINQLSASPYLPPSSSANHLTLQM